VKIQRSSLSMARPSFRCVDYTSTVLHFSYCFQGQFCKSPLLRVIFNGNLGDYSAIRSMRPIPIENSVDLDQSRLKAHNIKQERTRSASVFRASLGMTQR
jgi:hypothetical protein